MIRTYDIDDDTAALIRHRCGTQLLPAPTCDVEQRLVYTAQTFRDFHDGLVDEDARLLARLTDDKIDEHMGHAMDVIYEVWAGYCEQVLSVLREEFPDRSS